MLSKKVYLAFDGRMAYHRPIDRDSVASSPINIDNATDDEVDNQEMHCEIPDRIHAIYERLQELEPRIGCNRFIDIPCTPARRETIELVHSTNHYDFMKKTAKMSPEELQEVAVPHDLYFCNHTFHAAKLAVGGVVESVNAVTNFNKKSSRAIAIVRPPGHHAGRDEAMGFCYFNNVAIAAKHAIATGRAKRVFILDWDIHHGNGIQDVTYNDPQIFYLSIHRASFSRNQKNWFYPGTGKPSETGKTKGVGTNLNVVFGEGGMTDGDYAATMTHVVVPVLYNYKPDLILIACGFDAAKGDLIGDCGLTPDMYYSMTRSLIEASPKTPIVVALEGGYNVNLSALCMEKVALALLDESSTVEDNENCVVWTSKSILPLRAPYLTRETSRLKHQCDFWDQSTDTVAANATRSNKVAIKSIKRTTAALERKGGVCLCGCHYLCHHSASLPMKKRKCINNGSSTSSSSEEEEALERAQD